MNVRFARFSPRTLLIRIGAVVVPLAVFVVLLAGLANAVVERSLQVAYPGAEISHSNAWYEWDGDVTTTDIVIRSPQPQDEAAAIAYERVRVETRGWFWVLRHLFDRRLERSGLARLRIELAGGQSAQGAEPSLGTLGPFGAISAAPFEAEGCMLDRVWQRAELEAMGLSLGDNRLDFEFELLGATLTTRVLLDTPGASRATFERVAAVEPGLDVMAIGEQAGAIRSERWEVRDQGFVSARNRFCTRKDAIDLRRFIERHVESVERLLATVGFAVDPDSRIAYRRYVRDGGTLVFSVTYDPAIAAVDLLAARRRGSGLERMNARIEHNGRGNAVVWQRFAPRPLAFAEDNLTTYAALSREQTAALRGESLAVPIAESTLADGTVATTAAASSPPATAPADVAPATTTPAPVVVSDAGMPSSSDIDAVPPTAEPAPAATPDAAATPGEVSSAADAATSPPVTVPSATPAPAKATTPAKITKVPPVVSSGRKRLEWSALPEYRGRLVRIWTMHNPPRTVEILSGDANSIRVVARLGGGQGEYTIQREAFLRATLVR
jgi:hypothetical protein